jgi:hypothetical protein
MKIKTIALASLFALSSTLAFAQSSQGKAGSDNRPTSTRRLRRARALVPAVEWK